MFILAHTSQSSSLSSVFLSSSDDGYSSSSSDVHAAHATRYGYAPGYKHDAWRPTSTWYAHGNGAPRFASAWPEAGGSTADGSGEGSHDVAGGEGKISELQEIGL